MIQKFQKFQIFKKMFSQNILDESNPQKQQYSRCKIKYLRVQNRMMTIQLNSICTLIQKYKQIINLLSTDRKLREKGNQENKQNNHNNEETEHTDEKQIEKLLKEAEKVIENCIKQCRQLNNNNNIYDDEEIKITPGFFTELVISYQKTIKMLKHNIHHREMLLQELQKTHKHCIQKNQEYEDHLSIIKVIENYDVYPKLAQKCRKQILELKEKKKLFDINFHIQNDKKHKSSSGIQKQNEKQIKRQWQKLMDGLTSEMASMPDELISPFEKVILIYKKKKLLNDILQLKIMDIKKKIRQKQACNGMLQKKLQNEVWNNVQNVNCCGYNMEESDPGYLSILNQSVKANHLEFSVDLSKIGGYCENAKLVAGNHFGNVLGNLQQDYQRVGKIM